MPWNGGRTLPPFAAGRRTRRGHTGGAACAPPAAVPGTLAAPNAVPEGVVSPQPRPWGRDATGTVVGRGRGRCRTGRWRLRPLRRAGGPRTSPGVSRAERAGESRRRGRGPRSPHRSRCPGRGQDRAVQVPVADEACAAFRARRGPAAGTSCRPCAGRRPPPVPGEEVRVGRTGYDLLAPRWRTSRRGRGRRDTAATAGSAAGARRRRSAPRRPGGTGAGPRSAGTPATAVAPVVVTAPPASACRSRTPETGEGSACRALRHGPAPPPAR